VYDISPSVLDLPGTANDQLLWIKGELINGQPRETLWWTSLNAIGEPVNTGSAWVPNSDPNMRRNGVRGVEVFADAPEQVAFFHGGVTGQNHLYYAVKGDKEKILTLPDAILQATDVAPIVRIFVGYALPDGYLAPSVLPEEFWHPEFVDVYFSGTTKDDNRPDMLQSRYRVSNGGTLVLTPFPKVVNESLLKSTTRRDGAWESKHMAWYGRIDTPTSMPVIAVNGVVLTNPNQWRYDSASQVFVQRVARLGNPLDAGIGVVRFRGTATNSPIVTDKIQATYTPLVLRLTPDETADTETTGFMDGTSHLAPTTGVINCFGTIGNIGRQWLVWRKGSSLYQSVRRVGIDLKLGKNESVALAAPTGATQNMQNVVLGGLPVSNYEVDISNGRIYVDPRYEGLIVDVTATVALPGGGFRLIDTTGLPVAQKPKLAYIDEPLNGKLPGDTRNIGVQMIKNTNEGQPTAFLDLYNINGLAGGGRMAGVLPSPSIDPIVQPGKVWVFWTSGRTRTQGSTSLLIPNGFNLYYQTMAPNFSTRPF
jgi:hypothetical protein